MTQNSLTVAVLGAGHGGHAMAGHLALCGAAVNVYNRSPERIATMRGQGGVWVEGAVQGFGRVNTVTTDLGEALADADLIMVVVPASAHRSMAQACAPHLRHGQIVVLNPGRTGGALEFAATLRAEDVAARVIVAETQTLIYSCRLSGPGRVHVLSLKRRVPLSALPATDSRRVLDVMGSFYPQFVPAPTVLHTGLGNVGSVFHPSLMLFNANRIEARELFYFYRDITPHLGSFLEAVDGERLAVARAFGLEVESASEWLSQAYERVSGQSLYEKIRSVPAYQQAMAPTSLDDRYLTEDVPTGLVPLIALAEVAGVPVPLSRSLAHVACALLERDYWAEGRTLERMGLQGMSVGQIMRYAETGERRGAS